MKILFTAVGCRVELIQAFHSAAESLGVDLVIYGVDITNTAPALQFVGKKVLVPRISDESYLPILQKFCEDEGIDALIPTIDTDLLLLSQHRNEFGKMRAFVSSPDKIKICRDKRFTSDYFNSLGLHSPHPVDDWKNYDGGFLAFIVIVITTFLYLFDKWGWACIAFLVVANIDIFITVGITIFFFAKMIIREK